MSSFLTVALFSAAFASGGLQHQSAFSVIVEPTAIDVRGDTVRVTLGVRNLATSGRDLWILTVDAPVPAVTVEQLGSPDQWDMEMAKEFGISVATWGFISPHLAPGNAAPPLAFSAVGLPGLVRYWAEPFVAPDTIDSGDVHVASASPGPWNSALDSGVTIGIVPFPPDRSRGALLTRMRGLVRQSCAQRWIDNVGVCNSLAMKIEHDDTGALLNELEAQRGKHVNALAYFLLVGNARALPSR